MCLSADNFDTFYFGTVAGVRDARKLAKGEFQIKFECTAVPETKPFIRYVMVESPVYFEVALIQLNDKFENYFDVGVACRRIGTI